MTPHGVVAATPTLSKFMFWVYENWNTRKGSISSWFSVFLSRTSHWIQPDQNYWRITHYWYMENSSHSKRSIGIHLSFSTLLSKVMSQDLSKANLWKKGFIFKLEGENGRTESSWLRWFELCSLELFFRSIYWTQVLRHIQTYLPVKTIHHLCNT